MATKFLEPGGDATFNATGTTSGGIWGLSGGSPTVATDFVHGKHQKSISYPSSGQLAVDSVLSDAGSRISVYIYVNTLPSATATLLAFADSLSNVVTRIRLSSTGAVQLFEVSNQIGSDGPTLSIGRWYRISIAYIITSTTINRFEVFVDGVSAISVTNATLNRTGSSRFLIGNISGNGTLDFRSSDHYVDDSNSLTDTGNVWVAAKRPNANGTTNNFITQIGSGSSGYGSGHSPQVNERPVSTTNGWSISSSNNVVEEYTIEGAAVGDMDMSTATFVDYMGWVYAGSTASESASIIVGGTTSTISLTTTSTVFKQIKGSNTYPAGNTDIGMQSPSSGANTQSLYEAGIIVAFIPRFIIINEPTTVSDTPTIEIVNKISISESTSAITDVISAVTSSALGVNVGDASAVSDVVVFGGVGLQINLDASIQGIRII